MAMFCSYKRILSTIAFAIQFLWFHKILSLLIYCIHVIFVSDSFFYSQKNSQQSPFQIVVQLWFTECCRSLSKHNPAGCISMDLQMLFYVDYAHVRVEVRNRNNKWNAALNFLRVVSSSKWLALVAITMGRFVTIYSNNAVILILIFILV